MVYNVSSKFCLKKLASETATYEGGAQLASETATYEGGAQLASETATYEGGVQCRFTIRFNENGLCDSYLLGWCTMKVPNYV